MAEFKGVPRAVRQGDDDAAHGLGSAGAEVLKIRSSGECASCSPGATTWEAVGIPAAREQVTEEGGVAGEALEAPAKPLGAAAGVVGLGLGIGGAEVDVGGGVVAGPQLALGV